MPLLAPCIPLLSRGTVPPLLLVFLPWLPPLSCASLCPSALRVPFAPLCVSPAPRPCALTSCHAIAPLLISYPLDSDGPVCTIPSAVSAVAVLSPLCSTRVLYPCPSLLSLPFSLVFCCTLTLPTLLCLCSPSLCFTFVPRLSPLPGRHGFMSRGARVYLRTGLWSCSWTGYMMDCWDLTTEISLTQQAQVNGAWGPQ